ncbi:hypothetical protein K450DRAFT_222305 [Umbelopsis ramanniana AG]|uniref:3-hydroxyacyl-CoA dehydrogenase n=1 Tax=Umbelopsis ramanniana AG TaxID=1314678 RepID=A0AAD5EHM9_UMBRA|nr:uncharacterized protein K450DRAFT_222305 [Umbelopsis ramanniana AG]KAI8583689.1 hypothetical protein K450DRAFT_222305 [Umbelopsis ramanniana AG]
MKFSGNTFVVTGGASGLGEATVRKIVEQGGNAVIIDVNTENAKKLSEELGEDRVLAPGRVDVTDEDQVDQALALAVERFGTLGGAIICHGVIGAPTSIPGYGPSNGLTSVQQVKFVNNINFIGVYTVAQKVSEIIIKQETVNDDAERGVIVMVSSSAGLDGVLLAYGVAKAGVAGLILPMARELAPFGIRVMGIAPGGFMTPMAISTAQLGDAFVAPGYSPGFPRRAGDPSEFAFMVSHIVENPMLNGHVVRLDAGVRLH